MKERIKLPYDGLIGILQGKEIHWRMGDNEIIIAPPFDGVFLTHDQIQQIQYSSEVRIFDILQKIYESKQEHYSADIEVLDE